MKAFKLSDFAVLQEQPSPEIRAMLAEQIAVAFNEKKFSEAECSIVKEIILLLASDVEMKIRGVLSKLLRENHDLPHDIALKLAKDVEQVATPMLEFSPVLTDDDLLEIIRSTRETKKLIAVARRKHLKEVVSESIVESGNTAAATALFGNDSADISEESIVRVFDIYSRNETVLDALIERGGLPLTVAQRFITSLTLNLQRKLTTKYGMPLAKAESMANEVRERATVEIISRQGTTEQSNQQVANHLSGTEQLTHSLMLRALCEGNIRLFESSLAEMARIPIANARKLIRAGDEQGFHALYNACHLPEVMYPATEALLRCALAEEDSEEPISYAQRMLARIVQQGHQNVPHMGYIVTLLHHQRA